MDWRRNGVHSILCSSKQSGTSSLRDSWGFVFFKWARLRFDQPFCLSVLSRGEEITGPIKASEPVSARLLLPNERGRTKKSSQFFFAKCYEEPMAGEAVSRNPGALFEVFVHAEWSPDADDDRSQADDIRQDEDESEKDGQRRFADGLLAACSRKAAPLLSWQAGKDLGLGILGGGMHGPAGRARALLRPSWSLLLSPTCQNLAVSRDGGVTLLSGEDEFSSPRGEWEAAASTGPMSSGQWRRMAWSHDGMLLAVSDAYGRATLLSHQALRPVARMQAVGTDCPVADLAFLPSTAPTYTLAALSFDGLMYTLPFTLRQNAGVSIASPSTSTPPSPLSLSPWHTNVSCMTVSHKTGLVAFGGWNAPLAASSGSAANAPPSVTVWRIKEDGSLSLELLHCMSSSGLGDKGVGLVSRVLAALSLSSNSKLDMDRAVLKLRFSPSGRLLAVLEAGGALFILDCVSFKTLFQFDAQELYAGPAGDDWSRTVSDVEWWNDTALVLSRRNGTVTANELSKGLPNMGTGALGSFHFMPCLTSATSADEGGMFVLECRRRFALHDAGEVPGGADVTPSSEAWYVRFLPGGMAVTERAKGESYVRRLRLVSIFQSTAERLLQRRIEKKEYLAALELARAYGLSTDVVYKSQWMLSDVTPDSIRALLPKIEDRAWVLEQCVVRIPATVSGAKALLGYGLQVCVAGLEDASPMDDEHTAGMYGPGKDLFERYLDRLEVFARIHTEERLDPARFRWFCESSVVHAARMFALEENTAALRTMLDRYPEDLAEELYSVLESIPETLRPRKYESLLPQVNSARVRDWYAHRAKQIECRSGLVDNALELLEYAQARGIDVDASLMQNMSQLHTLVYECGVDISLAEYQRTGEAEKLRLFTHNSTKDTFVEDLRTRAAPFLSSLGTRGEKLLHEYLLSLAEDRIDWCAEVFDASKITEPLFALTTREQGSGWLPIMPCYFTPWSPPPPDCLELRAQNDVTVIRHDDILDDLFDHISRAISEASLPPKLAILVTTDAEVRTAVLSEPEKSEKNSIPTTCPPTCVVTLPPSQQQAYFANSLIRVCRRRVLYDPVVMLDLALQCVYKYKSLGQLEAVNTIYTSLPQRNATLVGRVADQARYAELQDRADTLDKHLTANEILERYRLAKPMSFFLTCEQDPAACKSIIKSMCRGLVRQQVRDLKVWRALKEDLMGPPSKANPHGGLMVAVFSFMPRTACTFQYLEALLEANMFEIAREEMQTEIDAEDAGDGVTLPACVAIVLKVARDNADSAASVHDAAWENAHRCIDLIPSEVCMFASSFWCFHGPDFGVPCALARGCVRVCGG
jgi:hypothetical protein